MDHIKKLHQPHQHSLSLSHTSTHTQQDKQDIPAAGCTGFFALANLKRRRVRLGVERGAGRQGKNSGWRRAQGSRTERRPCRGWEKETEREPSAGEQRREEACYKRAWYEHTHTKLFLINTSSTQSPPPLLWSHKEAFNDTHVTLYHQVSCSITKWQELLHILYSINQTHHTSRPVNAWIDTQCAPALNGVTTSLCSPGAKQTVGKWAGVIFFPQDKILRDDGSSFFLSFCACVCICYFVCRGSHENHLQNECRDTGKTPLRPGLEVAAHQDFCETFRQLPVTILISHTRLPVL